MIVDESEMIMMEGYDLINPETVAINVEFSRSTLEDPKMSMDFPEPKLKQQIKIQHVQHTTGATARNKRRELF